MICWRLSNAADWSRPPVAQQTDLSDGGNEAALMSSLLARLTFITTFVFSPASGPGEFRRSAEELEGHRDRHGGDPGRHVPGHPLRRHPHAR